MSESLVIQYIRDPSSLEAKDLPRLLGEVERLRAELWSALCAAVATTRGTTPSGDLGFLTVAEVAAKLKFSRGHVYELVRQGRLRVVRAGRSVRVPVDALRELHTIRVTKAIDVADTDSRRLGRGGRAASSNADTEAGTSGKSPSSPRGRRRKGTWSARPTQSRR
jgi:excisionase family DNA binding protein